MGVPIKSFYTGLMEASFEAQLHALQTLEKGVANGPKTQQAHQWVEAEPRPFEAAIGRGRELACTLISRSLTTQRFLNLSRRKTTS